MNITQVGAIAFAIALVLANRAIGLRTGIFSAAATVVFPPWILPGAGLLIIALALLISRSRREGLVVPTPAAV